MCGGGEVLGNAVCAGRLRPCAVGRWRQRRLG